MIRPILAYGHPVLRQKCDEVDRDLPGLDRLIADLWETMEHAKGCGLASSQTGIPIKLFVVDSKSTYENLSETERRLYYAQDDKGIKETFINARIIQRSQECLEDEEGCLSIPDLFCKVKRNQTITIDYYNRYFERQVRSFSGTTARMIQHEYDHTEGLLFLDYLKPLTRKLLEAKLKKIIKGQTIPRYPMKFTGL